jgi:hypothetical protein
MTHLVQEMKIATGTSPVTGAGAAINSNGINLNSGHDLYIVCQVTARAATAVTFIPQRDDALGTGYIAIANNARIWLNNAVGTNDVLVRQADGVNQITDALAASKMVVFQINGDSLGLHTGGTNQPCTRVRMRMETPAATDEVSVVYYLVPRYPGGTVAEVRV